MQQNSTPKNPGNWLSWKHSQQRRHRTRRIGYLFTLVIIFIQCAIWGGWDCSLAHSWCSDAARICRHTMQVIGDGTEGGREKASFSPMGTMCKEVSIIPHPTHYLALQRLFPFLYACPGCVHVAPTVLPPIKLNAQCKVWNKFWSQSTPVWDQPNSSQTQRGKENAGPGNDWLDVLLHRRVQQCTISIAGNSNQAKELQSNASIVLQQNFVHWKK